MNLYLLTQAGETAEQTSESAFSLTKIILRFK